MSEKMVEQENYTLHVFFREGGPSPKAITVRVASSDNGILVGVEHDGTVHGFPLDIVESFEVEPHKVQAVVSA